MNQQPSPGRSKFLKMPVTGQHKWLARLLQQGFVEALGFSPRAKERFVADYFRYLRWMASPLPERPIEGRKGFEQWLSNQFHQHQQATGLGLGAEGFLVRPLVGDQLEPGPWNPALAYWVALENIRSAFNLGSMLRNIDALGFTGLILGANCPPLGHNQVRKTAMGTENWIPVHRPKDFWGHLHAKQQEGSLLIGVERTDQSLQARKFPWPEKAVLLLGNEEFGLSDRALSVVTQFVHLPMSGRKNSLNVACAFAALGYQITPSSVAHEC